MNARASSLFGGKAVSHTSNRLAKQHFDIQLCVLTYTLAIFGVIAVTAATYVTQSSTPEVTTLFARITQSYYGRWQGIFLLISPLVMAGVLAIDYRFLGTGLFANALFIGACALLLLAYTSEAFRGVQGWISLIWERTVQPAELAKLAIIIRLAQRLSKKDKPLSGVWDFIRMGMIVAIPVGIILLQGEMGSAVVILFFVMAMIIIAGVDARVILGILLAAGAMTPLLVMYMQRSGSYRFERLLAFIDPASASSDVTYQQRNAQIAVGSGGAMGQGLFQDGSLSSLNFVPEDYTDFIFSSIGETMGFAGCAALLTLYLLLVVRMIILAINTHDKFGQLIIVGVATMLMFHIYQGVGMCVGLMPVMGIPLPFVSYGGSNLTVNMAGIALVLNVTLRKPQPTHAEAPAATRPRRIKPPRGNRGAERAAKRVAAPVLPAQARTADARAPRVRQEAGPMRLDRY
ncbi:MAG: FtsW/RodA/SpoVE family cell cycle protein [Oscillospiraceae bacterium]|nr:FtsW/RodA/SpoVE family cell cycle protein [Oscillospiraceae bacterium]